MKPIVIYLLIALFGFANCTPKASSKQKPVTNIQITPANRTVSYGNEITINLQSRNTKPEIVELELYLGDRLLESTTHNQLVHTLSTANYLPGQYTIRAVAKNSKGVTGVNNSALSIVSDLQPKRLSYRIIGTLPHSEKNFTQGFEFHNGILYEGTGNHGESYVYAYEPKTMKELKSVKLDDKYFGEGITILNGKIYQLTYKAQKGFVYNLGTFEKIGEFRFPSKEGWGLTNNGKHLIMSDGTTKVTYLDPENFSVVKVIEVSHPGGFVNHINELEYVNGVIYANVWPGDNIVKFEAETGRVLAFIDMQGLLGNFNTGRTDVFNGIAYHPGEELFYVTGKWWPRTFKVVFE
jgi:glutaminyl-peptide cyclotransferase